MAIRAKDRERAADIEAPDPGAAGAGAMEAGPAAAGPAAARHHVLVMPDGYCLPAVTWEPAGPARGTVIALHAFGDFRAACGSTPSTSAASATPRAMAAGTASAAWSATCAR